jgi:hypothetical protein
MECGNASYRSPCFFSCVCAETHNEQSTCICLKHAQKQ